MIWFYYIALIGLLQKPFQIELLPLWKNEVLVLNKPYTVRNGSLKVDQWKCYWQARALYYQHKPVFVFPENHHLANAENQSGYVWTCQLPDQLEFDAIEIQLGVDSGIQEQGVLGGDLDPEQGMYWSWQSGYIHHKIETRSSDSSLNFILHVGGYRSPYNTIQTLRIPIKTSNTIQLGFAVDEYLQEASNLGLLQVMRPGTAAMDLAEHWSKTLKYIQP